MKCARLHLQERYKTKIKPGDCYSSEKPLRYCQKRMINPEHEEDPRWADAYERFHCHDEYDASNNDVTDSDRGNTNTEDLFLSVQTLQFQGNVEQPKRSRSSFKFKCPSVGGKHRMFVKQMVPDDDELTDDGRASQLTSYYYDDYVKYLFNNDKSRPTSGKSSIFLQTLSNKKENKATQIDEPTGEGSKKLGHGNVETKHKSLLLKKIPKQDIKDEIKSDDADTDDTKITYRKSGRRKSLTISRTQSPEVMQVIRVDVVCNHSRNSVLSDYEENKKLDCNESLTKFDIQSIDMKKSHFADKYLLTKTIKTLDENLAGGEKVTLLCKTFKLSERSQLPLSNKPRTITESKTTKTSKKNAQCRKLQDQVSKMIFRFNNI